MTETVVWKCWPSSTLRWPLAIHKRFPQLRLNFIHETFLFLLELVLWQFPHGLEREVLAVLPPQDIRVDGVEDIYPDGPAAVTCSGEPFAGLAELTFKTIVVNRQRSTWSRKPPRANDLAHPCRFVQMPWGDGLVVAILCAGEIDGKELSATECEFQDFVITLTHVEYGNVETQEVDIGKQCCLAFVAFRMKMNVLSVCDDALLYSALAKFSIYLPITYHSA